MTCKDCLFYDFCNEYNEHPEYAQECAKAGKEFKCSHFKDKSRFVELPCKVGDTAYMPWEFCGTSGIAHIHVKKIVIDEERQFIITDLTSDDDYFMEMFNGGKFEFSDFGKTVFLTREEAEKALEERRDK